MPEYNEINDAETYNYETIRAITQAVAIIDQCDALKDAFDDLNETTWLELHTKDKECFILTQIATSIKHTQVRYYTAAFIKRIQSVLGLDIITLTIDEPSKLWKLDDVIQALSDGEIKSHEHLFKELLVNVYGLSGRIVNFIFGDRTRKELYAILSDFYNLSINDEEEDKKALSVDYRDNLMVILSGNPYAEFLFKVNV